MSDFPHEDFTEDEWQTIAQGVEKAVFEGLNELHDMNVSHFRKITDDSAPLISGAMSAVVGFAMQGEPLPEGELRAKLIELIDEAMPRWEERFSDDPELRDTRKVETH